MKVKEACQAIVEGGVALFTKQERNSFFTVLTTHTSAATPVQIAAAPPTGYGWVIDSYCHNNLDGAANCWVEVRTGAGTLIHKRRAGNTGLTTTSVCDANLHLSVRGSSFSVQITSAVAAGVEVIITYHQEKIS